MGALASGRSRRRHRAPDRHPARGGRGRTSAAISTLPASTLPVRGRWCGCSRVKASRSTMSDSRPGGHPRPGRKHAGRHDPRSRPPGAGAPPHPHRRRHRARRSVRCGLGVRRRHRGRLPPRCRGHRSGVRPGGGGVRGRRAGGGISYAAGIGAIMLSGRGGSLVVTTPSDGARLVVLGSADPLTNQYLDEDGNASLALGLLGEHSGWSGAGRPSRPFPAAPIVPITDLLPDWVVPATWQLGIAVALAAVWRARQLGPIVTEPLPVVVRGAETTEGRALYRRGRARDHAAATLRRPSVRLRGRLGLHRDARTGRRLRRGGGHRPAARDRGGPGRSRPPGRRGTGPPRRHAGCPGAGGTCTMTSPVTRPAGRRRCAGRPHRPAPRGRRGRRRAGLRGHRSGDRAALPWARAVGRTRVAKTLLVRTWPWPSTSRPSGCSSPRPDAGGRGSLVYDARTARVLVRTGRSSPTCCWPTRSTEPAEDMSRPAGGDGGAAGLGGGHAQAVAGPVRRRRHAERSSTRAPTAAGGPARPILAQADHRRSRSRRRDHPASTSRRRLTAWCLAAAGVEPGCRAGRSRRRATALRRVRSGPDVQGYVVDLVQPPVLAVAAAGRVATGCDRPARHQPGMGMAVRARLRHADDVKARWPGRAFATA